MKHVITSVAISAALAFASTTLPARAMPLTPPQEHHDADHPDYSNNKYYRLGNKEGYEDHRHKQQRPAHEHKYRNDDDRKAHDYGYQQGWSGDRYDTHHPH